MKDWYTANSICALLRRPFGGSCTVNAEETELLGRWSCHIPLHPLQVKMQNCSLKGNYFPSKVLNFSSGLACLTYKKLELGRKRKKFWNKGAHSSSLFELKLFTLITASLWQQHWRPVPAPARTGIHPNPPHLQHLMCSPAATHPAWTHLLEQELCTGMGSSPHSSASWPHRAAPGALIQSHCRKEKHLAQRAGREAAGVRPTVWKGMSRAATLMFVLLISGVILRFSCP